MDFSAIGKKVKELRKSIGLSQAELAEGICTQAQISKIENGDVIPLASTLYLLAQRLGLSVDYFFDISLSPRLDYVHEVSEQLKLARKRVNYALIKEIVENEEKNPLFTENKYHYQLLIWHKAIYSYHLHHQFDLAMKLIDDAIAITFEKVQSEREIEIFFSKGIFYFEEKRYKEALEVYQEADKRIKNLLYLKDTTIRTRISFNMAKSLTFNKQYEQSINVCQSAIEACLQNDDLYLLGELTHQLGYNYELQEKYQQALPYFEKSLFIFKMQKNSFISIAADSINNIKSQILS